ncbi:MAG TPA: DUF1688 family protein, partial [Polyangiaceae bacterium]|nr:DUF1688 family protein [Polyangiaceae bacterium]
GGSACFSVDRSRLWAVEARVERVLDRFARCERAHGRLCHFDAGGVPRRAELDRRLSTLDPLERARALTDLVVTSVLLDAGAGDRWRYRDGDAVLSRSEGLAVASLRLFLAGAFASDGAELRCDASALESVTSHRLAAALDVRPDNPLVGLEGRAHLLSSLGAALSARPELFGSRARPGNLVDWARARASAGSISARTLLAGILDGLSPIWPGRASLHGENLGDVWPHPALGEGAEGLVPFHKLSQWIVYSLVEPLAVAGLAVSELDSLTVLAEYRTGGLLVDLGVLELADASLVSRALSVGDAAVVEWRALTVALFDEIVPSLLVRAARRTSPAHARSLVELAAWTAGREVARELRPCGGPPLRVESDGTVF